MKIILLVTVCNHNKTRIQNQIRNLDASPLHIDDTTFHPIFVFGKESDVSDIPYETLVVDEEEKYSNLYKKLFSAYKIVNANHEYNFICKIDDDTKINLHKFKKEWIENKDLIGKIYPGNSNFSITLDLDFYDIHKTISLVPSVFNKIPFNFATGDAYFLSKKAINHILSSENILTECEGLRTCEDRLFGYMLNDKNIIINDISLKNKDIEENMLQVSKDYFSIHPINDKLFSSLIGIDEKEQFSIICKNPTLNLIRRRAYIKSLETKIINAINDFVNSPKSMGLG